MPGETRVCTHPEEMLNGKPSKISDNRSSRGLKLSVRQSCLEASEASSGSSIPQKIIDVVIPVRISNEISEATHSAGLEQALSIPLLQGNSQASVPSIQDGDFPPVSSACDLWILLGDGVNGIP